MESRVSLLSLHKRLTCWRDDVDKIKVCDVPMADGLILRAQELMTFNNDDEERWNDTKKNLMPLFVYFIAPRHLWFVSLLWLCFFFFPIFLLCSL